LSSIRLAGLVKGSVVDGLGIRVVVFFQGCPRHCPGCHNEGFLAADGGEAVAAEDLVARIGEGVTPLTRGLTISGGDPFFQPRGLFSLCRAVRENFPNLDIWVYTGYSYEEVAGHPVLPLIDVLVDGPFLLAVRDLSLPFRGSPNQRLIDVPKTLAAGRVVGLVVGEGRD